MSVYNQNRANNFNVYGEFNFSGDFDITPLKYNLQTMATPTITLSPVILKNGGHTGTIPGDELENEPSVPLRFILDENLQVLFNLMDIQKRNHEMGYSDDQFVMIVNDNTNKAIARFEYNKCWINTVGNIDYDITDDTTTLFVDVIMNYLDYKPTSLL